MYTPLFKSCCLRIASRRPASSRVICFPAVLDFTVFGIVTTVYICLCGTCYDLNASRIKKEKIYQNLRSKKAGILRACLLIFLGSYHSDHFRSFVTIKAQVCSSSISWAVASTSWFFAEVSCSMADIFPISVLTASAFCSSIPDILRISPILFVNSSSSALVD